MLCSQKSAPTYLVFLELLPLPFLQGRSALLGFEPLLLQPTTALLELLLPQCLSLLLLLQPHCLLGRCGKGVPEGVRGAAWGGPSLLPQPWEGLSPDCLSGRCLRCQTPTSN